MNFQVRLPDVTAFAGCLDLKSRFPSGGSPGKAWRVKQEWIILYISLFCCIYLEALCSKCCCQSAWSAPQPRWKSEPPAFRWFLMGDSVAPSWWDRYFHLQLRGFKTFVKLFSEAELWQQLIEGVCQGLGPQRGRRAFAPLGCQELRDAMH